MDKLSDTFSNLQIRLSQAIQNDDQASIESLLIADCPEKSHSLSDIPNPLITAIIHNRLEIIQLLINKGACVKCPLNWLKQNALHIAVMYRNIDIIRLILESNADWNSVDENGANCIHLVLLGHEGMRYKIESNNIVINKITSKDEQLKIIEIIKIFLDLELNINEFMKSNESPLELTIKTGMLEISKYLIENGADPYIFDKQGDRLLHMLIKYLILEIDSKIKIEILNFVQWLQFKEIDVNIPNINQITPLQLAIAHDLDTLVPILMGVTDIDTNFVNLHVILAKFYDAKFGYIDNESNSSLIYLISKLLDDGADVNAVDKSGNTPLHIVAMQKDNQMIQLMLQHFTNVNAQSKWGDTVLHILIKNCVDTNGKYERFYEEYVSTLFSKGADVNLKNKKGITPVQLAIQRKHAGIFKILAENGADLKVKTEQGDDLFSLLLENSFRIDEPQAYRNIIEVLVNNGFNINKYGNNGSTCLHEAIMWGDYQLINALLLKGANVNCIGFSLLHIAIQCRTLKEVIILLRYGVNVNELTKDGESSLVMAIKKNKIELIDILLNNGADVNLCSKKMKLTALHVAADANKVDVVKILVKAGANLNIKNKLGETPLHLAARHKSEMLEILVKAGAKMYVFDNKNRMPLHITIENDNSVGLYFLLKSGMDINEIGRVDLEMNSLFYKDTTTMKLLELLVRLYVANLLVPKLDEKFIRRHDVFRKRCISEVKRMKNQYIGPISLYDFIHLRPKNQVFFMDKVTYECYLSFPIYKSLIKEILNEAQERKKLLKLAMTAWYEITNVMLPELCLENIFDYLKNDTLKILVEYTGENRYRLR